MAEPPVELLHEAALRRSIHDVFDAAAADDDELACVREICQETLSRMNLMTAAKCVANRQECNNGAMDIVADGSGVVKAFTPPKSPQERLVAQNKPRLGRRPSCDSTPAEEVPRWKIIDGNEEPITDLTVIFRGDYVPEGILLFINMLVAIPQLERSPSGQRADLNRGGRGTFIYLCQSKDQSSGKAPISEIIAIFPERGEFVPSDYEVVRRRSVPANINTGTQGEKIYLCFKRSTSAAIVDLVVMFPRKNESLPYGYGLCCIYFIVLTWYA
eukprot:jgi/Phyca11/110523/e_gw1.18.496.1